LCLGDKKNKQKKKQPRPEASFRPDHNHDHHEQNQEPGTIQNTDPEDVHQPISPSFGRLKESKPSSPPPLDINLNNQALTR